MLPRIFATIVLLFGLLYVTGDHATAQAAADPPAAGAVEPAPAAADPASVIDAGWPGNADELAQAVRTGNWRLVVAFLLAATMLGLRKARDRVSWLKGDRGGAILVLALAILGTLVISLKGDAPINGGLFLTALAVAWTAVGGYTWLKRLIWPTDAKVTTATVEVTAPSPDRFVTDLRAKFDAAAAPPAGPGGV